MFLLWRIFGSSHTIEQGGEGFVHYMAGLVSRSTIGGGRRCNQCVPVLEGNGTKIVPTGTYLTNALVKCDVFGASLPTM